MTQAPTSTVATAANGATPRPPPDNNVPDDASDTTVSARFQPSAAPPGSKEFTIQFEFQPKTAAEGSRVALVHTHILQAIQTAFADDTTILTNKGHALERIDPVQWATPTQHQQYFNIHSKQTGKGSKASTRYYVIHRIHTRQSLSTLRRHFTVMALLQKHNCYMRAHSWDETIWDVQQAGVFIGLHPQYYTAEQGASEIKAAIVAAKVCAARAIPAFRLVYKTPRINVGGRQHSTKAYVIEVERKVARQAMQIFKATFKATHQFLPAKMRYTNPELFAKGLKGQDQYLRSIYCVPLLHLPADSIFYLLPHFQQLAGYQGLIPSKKAETVGKYHLLVKQQHFREVRKDLEANLTSTYEAHVPADARGHPEAFPSGPCVSAGSGYGSDESDYSASFATASYASLDLSVGSDSGTGQQQSYPPVQGVYVWSKPPGSKPAPPPPLAVPRAQPDQQSVSEVTAPTQPDLDALVAELEKVHQDNQRKDDTIAKQGADIAELTGQLHSMRTSMAQQSQQLTTMLQLLQNSGLVASASSPTPAPSSGSQAKRPPPDCADRNSNSGKHFRMDG